MTRECATCGGEVHYIDSHTESRGRRRSAAVIHNYRCRGTCRGGGFIAERQSDGLVLNQGGPAFEPGRFHRHAAPSMIPEVATGGGVRS